MGLNENHKKILPDFDFEVPIGYNWLIKHNLVGFDAFSTLEPWYYLDKNEYFVASQKWPDGPYSDRLVAFAKRQDCDDIACFGIQSQRVQHIVVIQGWTETGYDVVDTYSSFWEWMKSLIDDISEIADY